MKKMIRFLALALAMAMLTACGGNAPAEDTTAPRSEEHTSELQSR